MNKASPRYLAHPINDQGCVVITVVQVNGSAPREAGAQLLVFDETQSGTIGGGSMEHEALLQAREMLQRAGAAHAGAAHARHDSFTRLSRKRLEPSYDQCCGGAVVLLFEYMPADVRSRLDSLVEQFSADRRPYSLIKLGSFNNDLPGSKIVVTADDVIFDGAADQSCPREIIQRAKDSLFAGSETGDSCELRKYNENQFWVIATHRPINMNIYLFGAGHVGSALVQTLSAHDCSIRWVDNRENIFPANSPKNTQCIFSKTPAAEVGDAPRNCYYIVMTHSHSLDFEICDHILARDDVAYLGLIGSNSKALRFARQFKQRGLSAAEIARITCPIGISGIKSKKASAIAISVAAQLLLIHETGRVANPVKEHKMINLSQGLEVDTVGR